jgi:DedD protein
MKLPLDEKAKHRLIGLIVLCSFMSMVLTFLVSQAPVDDTNIVQVKMALPDTNTKAAMANALDNGDVEAFEASAIAKVDLNTGNITKSMDDSVATNPAIETPPSKQLSTTMPVVPSTIKPPITPNKRDTIPKTASTVSKPIKIIKAKPVNLPLKVKSADKFVSNTIAKIPSNKPTPMPKAMKPVNVIAKRPLLPTKPMPISLNKTTGRFGIQMASFSSRENANQLVNLLRIKRYQAVLLPRYQGNAVSYRVVVGKVPSRQDALTLQARLLKDVHMKGFIVPISGA